MGFLNEKGPLQGPQLKALYQDQSTQRKYVSQNHHAAREYAEKYGFYVFPVIPAGKAPLTPNGFLDATLNTDKIDDWWNNRPNANIGISCEPSKLFVLDFDSSKELNAIDAMADFELNVGRIPDTPHVLTGGKGMHFYFKIRDPLPSKIKIFPNTDIKCKGGYVVAPPSTHSLGLKYEWEACHRISDIKMAYVPEWLENLIKSRSVESKPFSFCKEMITQGARNQTLTRYLGHLLRRYVDPDLTSALIHSFNQVYLSPPLSEGEVDRILQSVAGLELKRRSLKNG